MSIIAHPPSLLSSYRFNHVSKLSQVGKHGKEYMAQLMTQCKLSLSPVNLTSPGLNSNSWHKFTVVIHWKEWDFLFGSL
jgi:hypothetical protein